jgi:predicted peptidase
MRLLSLLLLFISHLSLSQDLSLYLKKEFISPDGAKLPYRILFPEGYDKEKKYPLVLVLHGAGERGIDNEKQLIHGGKLFLQPEVRKKFPAIVVFPQCPQDRYWSSVTIDRTRTPLLLSFDYTKPITEPLRFSMALLDQLVREEGVNDRCIYVTGLSMGGMGTFEAVYRFPDTFAAALPICGGGDTVRYERVTTPFWVFHGAADAVVAVGYSRSMVAKLKEEKVKVNYTEYPGVNHNSWDSAFAEPDFLKWMFAKRGKKK